MSSAGIINFVYNETIVSRALSSSLVDYNWFTGINVWKVLICICVTKQFLKSRECLIVIGKVIKRLKVNKRKEETFCSNSK